MEIVYHCVAGRVADSPLAVHQALLAREDAGARRDHHTWLVDAAHAHQVPAGSATAPVDGTAASAALDRADVVVASTHLATEWRKRPGALYLQTWHGTPLKRIAGDELGAVRDPATGDVLVPDVGDVARWDVLLSPNRVSTSRLRGAFRYGGEVVESGLPRNDVLLAPDAAARRARVRERLGLRPDQVAVLWTPTWREGGAVTDVEAFCAAFVASSGDDHALLLRLHPYVAAGRTARVTEETGGPAVLDVSGEAQISDLYLAADALVADYSSTIVDFTVTGRPVLLFAPDLAHYVGVERGMYVDLAAEGPGPVLTSAAETVEALADLPALAASWSERYAAFRERYCHLEDGGATQRALAVLDRVLAPGAVDVREHEPLRAGRGRHALLAPSESQAPSPEAPGGTLSAVVLAAGLGSRLGRDLPKPLTPLPDGRSILAAQVDHLRGAFGPTLAITAVVGHGAPHVMAAVPDLLFAYSPRYASTNTATSLRRALATSRPGPVLWCNGDVVFDPALLAELAPAIAAGRTAVCVDTSVVGDEEVKYTLDARGLVDQLSKTVVDGLGEAVGINVVAAADRPLLLAHLEACADQDYFERGIETAIADGLEVVAVDISAYAAVEVDVEEDLVRAGLRVYGHGPTG